jgi:hypothetical protein
VVPHYPPLARAHRGDPNGVKHNQGTLAAVKGLIQRLDSDATSASVYRLMEQINKERQDAAAASKRRDSLGYDVRGR